jgi:hypothetical protein
MRRRAATLFATVALATAAGGLLTGCANPADVEVPGKDLMDRAHRAANEALVAAATTGLQALQATGAVTEAAVKDALEKAGGADAETRDLGDTLLFGAGVSGGCVYGSISDTGTVTIDLGGPTDAGGCLREP